MSGPSDYHDLVGTIRARRPEETMAFVRPKLASIGITRIARVTGLDCLGIPVSVAVRPGSRNLSVSQGKGYTPLLADVSAVMESIEFHHAETPAAPSLHGSYAALHEAHALVHPSAFVPGWFPRLDEDPEQGWIEAEDLIARQRVHVPHALINFDQTNHGRETMRLFVSTNGLASGNTTEEATCHALYEIIERDAVARWERRTEAEKAVDEVAAATVDGPVRWLLDRIEAAEMTVRIWEATAVTGIPTFVCHIRGDAELRGLGTFVGMGAHHLKDVALSRAVTEAAQSRLTVISGTRDDTFPEEYQRQHVTAAYALPLPSREAKPYDACAAPRLGGDFEESLGDLLDRITAAGYERVLRVEHTREAIGIPVVHCFVPGMQVPTH